MADEAPPKRRREDSEDRAGEGRAEKKDRKEEGERAPNVRRPRGTPDLGLPATAPGARPPNSPMAAGMPPGMPSGMPPPWGAVRGVMPPYAAPPGYAVLPPGYAVAPPENSVGPPLPPPRVMPGSSTLGPPFVIQPGRPHPRSGPAGGREVTSVSVRLDGHPLEYEAEAVVVNGDEFAAEWFQREHGDELFPTVKGCAKRRRDGTLELSRAALLRMLPVTARPDAKATFVRLESADGEPQFVVDATRTRVLIVRAALASAAPLRFHATRYAEVEPGLFAPAPTLRVAGMQSYPQSRVATCAPVPGHAEAILARRKTEELEEEDDDEEVEDKDDEGGGEEKGDKDSEEVKRKKRQGDH